MGVSEAAEVGELADALAGTRPFGELARELRAAVGEAGELVHAETGTTIVTEGEDSTGMYILLDGRCDVTVTLDDEHVKVGDVAAGEAFGELATLVGEGRSATVVATRPSRLLRLSDAAIESLLGRDASVGLALARDLAVRLRDALGEDNVSRARTGPAQVEVPAQDLSRLGAYQRRYYTTAMRNLVRRHRLLVDRDFPRYRTSFRVTVEERQRWFDLFVTDPRQRSAPFTYFTSSGTLLLMQVVDDVGINFRHLMHLRSEMAFHPEGRRIEPGVDYRLEVSLVDVVALADDRVALVLETRIHAPDDDVLVQLNREAFAVLAVDPGAMASLRESSRFGNQDTAEVLGPKKRRPTIDPAASTTVSVPIPEDMGLRYGRVSGDLNVVHTTRVAAKLFGYAEPFVQGLCTANHVLAAMTGALDGPVQQFDLSFLRRVVVDQTIDIRFDDRDVEVIDGKGKLVASGTHRR